MDEFPEMFMDNFPDYLMDAQYLLMPREVMEIDEDVRRVIYRESIAQKIFPTKQIPRGFDEWRVPIATQPSAPIFTKNFEAEAFGRVEKEEKIFYLVGLMKDYFISMKDIDNSRNSPWYRQKIDTLHLREMTASVAHFRELLFWRGFDILGGVPAAIDANLAGIVTDAGISTFNANGAAAKLGTAGDGMKGLADAVKVLVKAKYKPPFDTVMTTEVFGQLLINMNATTHVTDLERILGLNNQEERRLVKNAYISDALLNHVDTGATSAWAFIAQKNTAGEDTVQLLESYPLWHYPVNSTKLGIRGKILCMNGAAPIRPDAICFEDTIDVDGQ